MTDPFHYTGSKGLFFEALPNGGVAVLRKQEARLQSRTLLRQELTKDQWADVVQAMHDLHITFESPETKDTAVKEVPEANEADSLPFDETEDTPKSNRFFG